MFSAKNVIKGILLSLLGVVTILSLAFIGWSITYKQPQFFPLNDTKSTYTIAYSDDIYFITYSGKSPFSINTVQVGKSPVDLKPYIDKKVVIQGEFVQTSKQCMVNSCRDIGGPYVGLDIHSIKLR